MKDWHKLKPELFRKQPYHLPGCDSLEVSDDGCGISKGNEARIFDPFFTTRRESGGTGMGLAVVRNLLTAHRAEITLCNRHPTRFQISFGSTLTD
jgi:signal transduction histidine kinase